ncbi:MAG TPA: hypothetical protein VMA76_07735 [Solirubrobacteraceae bacterium]|nr:hypothetical protein [Solirubrobacteraceae bacterium]
MTDQSELRAALRERADQVPAASIARLSHLDYRPRTHRLRPPLAIGAFATAGTAGAVAIVISLSAGASNAFAGWSPKPTRPAPDQLAAASADCQTQSPVAGLPLKLADTRGPFTFSVYADSNSSATCIKGPTFTSVSNTTTSSPIDVPAGHILLSGSHATDRGGDAFSFADGRAGDGVSAVTLVLDDGTEVQATVANGWFVAWWPGAHDVKSADITTPSGTSTQTVDLAGGAGQCGGPPPPVAGPLCGGGGSVSAGGGTVTSGSSSGFSSSGGGTASSQDSTQTYGLSR